MSLMSFKGDSLSNERRRRVKISGTFHVLERKGRWSAQPEKRLSIGR